MRKYLLPASIASAAILSSFSAAASDGTITFNGQLVSNTCAVSAASKAMTVTLPTLAVAAFPTAGTVGGNTAFSMDVTGCPASITTATTYFETNPDVDASTGNLKPSAAGSAAFIQLKLTNQNGTPIDLSKSKGLQGVVPATVSALGAATARFAVEYVAVGGVPTAAGTANSSITYSMEYN